jgi:arsenate reductase
MAEGILKHYGRDRFEVFSAASEPSKVNVTAIKVMNEIGIDIAGQCSKNVRDFLGEHFHFIITVCDQANEHCPTFPGMCQGPALRAATGGLLDRQYCGKGFLRRNVGGLNRCQKLYWSFPDPPHKREITEETLNEFRKVRDMIHERFKQFAEAES